MENKLFMILVGCTPAPRLTEQHDIFFGIATSLQELLPQIHEFWPEANGKFHIDAWREVTTVDDYTIEVTPKQELSSDKKLFFINLGGYKQNEFEEYHYKLLSVAPTLSEAIKKSKSTAFYRHCNLPGAGVSHVDDKYGIDVDDAFNVADIVSEAVKNRYSIRIMEGATAQDELHIGYLNIEKLQKEKASLSKGFPKG